MAYCINCRCVCVCIYIYIHTDTNMYFLLKNILFIHSFIHSFIFREGKRGRKKGRETSLCGCLLSAPYWRPGPQPRHVTWLGIELATFWFAGLCSVHWATPARAFFFNYGKAKTLWWRADCCMFLHTTKFWFLSFSLKYYCELLWKKFPPKFLQVLLFVLYENILNIIILEVENKLNFRHMMISSLFKFNSISAT